MTTPFGMKVFESLPMFLLRAISAAAYCVCVHASSPAALVGAGDAIKMSALSQRNSPYMKGLTCRRLYRDSGGKRTSS